MFHAFGCGPRGRRGGFGPWGFDPGAFAGFWGAGGKWGGGGGGRGRVFEHGDLKFVILRLLADKPRHGYEIIKEIEDRVGGSYSPSPGTIYPTLSLLEDLGHIRVAAGTGEGGRKIYEITDEGRRFLEENRSTVDAIFERIDESGSEFSGHPGLELGQAVKDVAQASVRFAAESGWSPRQTRRAVEVLRRALREIEGLRD